MADIQGGGAETAPGSYRKKIAGYDRVKPQPDLKNASRNPKSQKIETRHMRLHKKQMFLVCISRRKNSSSTDPIGLPKGPKDSKMKTRAKVKLKK